MIKRFLDWLFGKKKIYEKPKQEVKIVKKLNKPPFQKLPKCPAILKTSYKEQLAKSEAEKMTKKGLQKIRAYKCEWCPYWHLTHKSNKFKIH